MLSFYEWLVESFGADDTQKKIIKGINSREALACYLVYTWEYKKDA